MSQQGLRSQAVDVEVKADVTRRRLLGAGGGALGALALLRADRARALPVGSEYFNVRTTAPSVMGQSTTPLQFKAL